MNHDFNDPKKVDGTPLSILYVWGNVTGAGGTERRMAEVARELVDQGHRVSSYVHCAGSSTLVSLLETSGSTVIASRGWFRLMRCWNEIGSDLVIAFGLRPSIVTRVMRLCGRKTRVLVMARNGLDFGWRSWMHLADRISSRVVDFYIANSRRAGVHLEEHGIAPRKVKVLTSALGREWTSTPPVARSRSGVIAMVGNSRPEKNHLFGLRVYLEANIDSALRVYTNDSSELAAFLEGSEIPPGIRARVELIEGHVVSVADLDEVDILLHPSLSESMPRIVLQARARGCYVVASNVGDTAQWVGNGDGVVISGFSEAEYVDALRVGFNRPRGAMRPLIGLQDTKGYVRGLLSICGLVGGTSD